MVAFLWITTQMRGGAKQPDTITITGDFAMSDAMQRMKRNEYIDIDCEDGEDLFNKFKSAWLKVPPEFRNSATIMSESIHFHRWETDAEFADRLEIEARQREAAQQQLALKKSSHLVDQLSFAINLGLAKINSDWENVKTGQSMDLSGSVPMLDGRNAAVKITVTAKEQVRSID